MKVSFFKVSQFVFYMSLLCIPSFMASAQNADSTSSSTKSSDSSSSSTTNTPPTDDSVAQKDTATPEDLLQNDGADKDPNKTTQTDKKVDPNSKEKKSKAETQKLIDDFVEDKIHNLIRINTESIQIKPDPYPLEKYTGTFLKDIKDIQKKYQDKKNLKLVKASLEKWLNDSKSPAPESSPNAPAPNASLVVNQNSQANPQVAVKPFPSLGFLFLGNIYDKLHVYDKSVAMYQEALKDSSLTEEDKVIFKINESQVLRHWGKAKKSLDLLDDIDSQYEKIYPEIFLFKGLSSVYLFNVDDSILNLRRYLELNPKSKQASKVKRAISWLLLSKNGGSNKNLLAYLKNLQGNQEEKDLLNKNRQDINKILKLLTQQEIQNQQQALLDKTESSLNDDKSLDIKEKDLDEGDSLDFVAE